MKTNKIAILALIPLTLSAVACSEIDAVSLATVREAADSTTRAKAIAEFLENPYQADSAVTTSYDSNTYQISDQVSSSARNTVTVLNGERVTERHSYIADSSGNAIREYLSISNVIEQEDLETDFDYYYGSPFSGIVYSNVNVYFNYESYEGGYVYTLNTLGVGTYNQRLITFYSMHDDYVWDSYTSADTVKNFKLYTDSDGNPTSWDFYLVRSDKFGGIYEHYTTTLTSITECDSLASYSAQSDETHDTALKNAIASLAEDIANSSGNFTEDFQWTVGTTTTNYSNYYDLFYTYNDDSDLYVEDSDHLGIMLSNNPLIDSSYGTTYTGLAWGYVSSTDSSYNTTYTYGYYYLGVSPEADYYSFLSTDCYDTLVEVVPLIGTLSSNFFVYNETSDTYEWDLAEFPYIDYESSLAIIYALFGVGDYTSAVQSNYVWDLDSVDFNFQKLSIALDNAGEIDTMTLDYINYNNVACSTTVSFKDFGTTDLENDEVIAGCLDILFAED